MNIKLLVALLSALSISAVVASERQRAACARLYASDLFYQLHAKDTVDKHDTDIHAFMRKFPQCEAAYGSKQEAKLFTDAAVYARKEGKKFHKHPENSFGEGLLAAIYYYGVGFVLKQEAVRHRDAAAYVTGSILESISKIAIAYNLPKSNSHKITQLRWETVAVIVNTERIKYDIERMKRDLAHGQ